MRETNHLFDLHGKTALVTGGSRGLGRQMVLAFAARGADVVVASRKLEACEEVAAETEDRFGVRALPVAVNVSEWDRCDELVARAYKHFGAIDVLVNNAGLSPIFDRLETLDEALYDKVFAVNLKGAFRLIAKIGPLMASGSGGSVINITSIAAIRPRPEFLPYAAAKAGLNTMTEGFARAFGPTVRVNAIQAGPFLTDISKAWDPDAFARRAKASMALERGGRPEEIVGAALYLASDASSFCTGAVLRLDGGEA